MCEPITKRLWHASCQHLTGVTPAVPAAAARRLHRPVQAYATSWVLVTVHLPLQAHSRCA